MSNATTKAKFAKELAEIMVAIEDKKIEARSLLEAAKEQGVDPKALAKVAKEMLKDSDKLRKQYEEEEQLDLFRAESGLFRMKGLDTTEKANAAFAMAGDRRIQQSAAALDAVAGTDIANTHKTGMAAVRQMRAKTHAKFANEDAS